jgi:undecaprenyl-diphosphatase
MSQLTTVFLIAAASAQSGVTADDESPPPETVSVASSSVTPPPAHGPFRVDPVTDTTLTVLGLGLAGLTELILSSGEIRPQKPGDPKNIIPLDRGAVTQRFDSGASSRSTIGLGAALGFAVLDPLLTSLRDGRDSALVDAVFYAESLSLAWSFTGLTKIAVRRPRPRAYQQQAELDARFGADKSPAITDTDSTLSFFSGHAAIVAAVSGTASYLAFTRSPHTARPWITLAVGSLLTAGVSIERVRAGAHFPTDVIAGSLAGAAIGLLVPHLHRFGPLDSERPVWISIGTPSSPEGLSLSGRF